MSMEDCPMEDRIGRVESAVERIEEQMKTILNEFSVVKERLDKVLKQAEEHQSILYGEKGSQGIIGWKEQANDTLDELKLALKGYGKEPGLISVIQNLSMKIDEWDDTRKWVVRLVIGYVVTTILGIILVAMK